MVDTVQPRMLASFRNRSASSLLMKMQLLRWNNAEPTPGPDTRPASSMVQGLDAAEKIRASGVGRKMFLTSPLIEQPIALKTRSMHYERAPHFKRLKLGIWRRF